MMNLELKNDMVTELCAAINVAVERELARMGREHKLTNTDKHEVLAVTEELIRDQGIAAYVSIR